MFVGTLPALMAPDCICLVWRATQVWTLPKYTMWHLTVLRNFGCSIIVVVDGQIS